MGSVSICVFSWAQPLRCCGPSQAGRAAELLCSVSALTPGGTGRMGAAGLTKITQRWSETQTPSAVIRSVHHIVLHATSNRPMTQLPVSGYTLPHLQHHSFQVSLACLLVCWGFSPSPPHYGFSNTSANKQVQTQHRRRQSGGVWLTRSPRVGRTH